MAPPNKVMKARALGIYELKAVLQVPVCLRVFAASMKQADRMGNAAAAEIAQRASCEHPGDAQLLYSELRKVGKVEAGGTVVCPKKRRRRATRYPVVPE